MSIPSELPKICVCIGHADVARSQALALASCDHGETLLELRIDMLSDPSCGAEIVGSIRDRHPGATVLATCRREGNGGYFRGSIDQQVDLLRRAVEAGAAGVDVEIETIEQEPRSLRPFDESVTTLASYHNFDRTPDLGPVMRRLEKTGADIYKVATRVVRPSDNLKLLALCRDRPNIVVAGMGETGALARLYSPPLGALFTYAAPDSFDLADGERVSRLEGPPTAPGQVAAASARHLYRVQRGTPDTRIYAVIAKPVGHSKSPLIHNRAFKARGFDGIYVPLLVERGHISDFFRTMREMPLSGVSVTIPHKQSVIRHLDSIDPLAEGVGAVNTIYWKNGMLAGTNTDAVGITAPLAKRVNLRGARSLVVGNGGAAKAAVAALKQHGANVAVTGRNARRVGRLARLHGVGSIEFARLGEHYFDVLVQATSVGMLPNVNGNLFPDRIPADVVFDLVYNPLETALLKCAAEEGKVAISGIEMFVEQAAAQFQIWTGLDAPREVMREAVLAPTVR
jgi:3-dehydroquinate dehydratase/shikimate dehydrogenase